MRSNYEFPCSKGNYLGKQAKASVTVLKKKPSQETSSCEPKFKLKLRNPAQQEYMTMIKSHDLTFGVGPAGTGKTFVAIAAAVKAYHIGQVKRIVLVRPVVETAEHLGFLPGRLEQKLDSYVQPLFDALQAIVGPLELERILSEKDNRDSATSLYARQNIYRHFCFGR